MHFSVDHIKRCTYWISIHFSYASPSLKCSFHSKHKDCSRFSRYKLRRYHYYVYLDVSIKMMRKEEWKLGSQSTQGSSMHCPICQASLYTHSRWTNSRVPNIIQTFFKVLPYWFILPEAVCSRFFSIYLIIICDP